MIIQWTRTRYEPGVSMTFKTTDPTLGLPTVTLYKNTENKVRFESDDLLEFNATELTWEYAKDLMQNFDHRFRTIFDGYTFLRAP